MKLPREAGRHDDMGFEPNDSWLASAGEELQIEAMRQWFLDRYEDPVMETPWDSETKSYIFVWGGPYDPNDVIQERFSHVVDYNIMESLIHELWAIAGDEWAPIHHEGVDYEAYIEDENLSQTSPAAQLDQRLLEIQQLAQSIDDGSARSQLILQMSHGMLISSLEAYLSDLAIHWVREKPEVLRRLLATCPDLKSRTLTLSELFARHESIGAEIHSFLTDFVWHRLDKAKPLLSAALDIPIPDISNIYKEVLVRHDIIHRSGRTKSGDAVVVTRAQLETLILEIVVFKRGIEEFLDARYNSTVI
ncbi:hypothetical protein [Thermomonas fusca]|uniref:hypothetical protein n=1 Tax=Thermomonas fusca TaxID=215690 RepID=UPI0012EBDABD|nr:hypothetical protein [Thermomonas fusca]